MKAFVITALLAAAATAPAAPKAGDAAPPLAIKDVKDRALQVPDPGNVMLLSFASKSNGEKAGDITRAMRVRFPEVKVLSFIDLSGFPGMLHGMIKSQILGRQPGAVKEANDAYAKAGKTPPADMDARIHIIPDFDESSCKVYGALDTGHQVEIVILGTDGTVKAIFTKTPSIEDVGAALEKTAGAP